MDQEQIRNLKSQLIQEKYKLLSRSMQNEQYGLDTSMNQSVGELSGYDNHPADLGTELFERGKDLALQDADERQLAAIEEAIERLHDGNYGRCEACSNPIPYERLMAVPWTTYCREHQPDPVSQRRPIEEKVLQFPTHSFRDDKGEASYDGEDAWQEVERYGTSNPPDFFRDGESYNELTYDEDEVRGYVDLTEGFSITSLDGNPEQPLSDITHSEAYRQKEEEL